jgi:putative membrane protein
MAFLSETDKQRIRTAIQRVEQRTRGEIVTVVARASDDYLYIPALWAGLLALTTPALAALLGLWLDLGLLALAQVGLFLVLLLLFQSPPIKMWLIPGTVKRLRAGRMAHEQFVRQGVHLTREHTGILLFVSLAERYVEIVADKGIHDRVAAGAWEAIVTAFTAAVRAGRVADGFVEAIEGCGELLAIHWPAGSDVINELPDPLVEL